MPALNACPWHAECSQTAAPFACLLVAVHRRPTKPCFLFRPKKALLRDRKMTSCCFISVTGVQRVCKQTDVQTLGTQPCKAQHSTIRFSHPSKMAAPEELLYSLEFCHCSYSERLEGIGGSVSTRTSQSEHIWAVLNSKWHFYKKQYKYDMRQHVRTT